MRPLLVVFAQFWFLENDSNQTLETPVINKHRNGVDGFSASS
jgi:hypothetical protein